MRLVKNDGLKAGPSMFVVTECLKLLALIRPSVSILQDLNIGIDDVVKQVVGQKGGNLSFHRTLPMTIYGNLWLEVLEHIIIFFTFCGIKV